MSYVIGDCLDELRKLPDGFAQTCICSPPYWGLRDYGVDGQLGLEETPDAYVARMVEVFADVRRVLRDDGTLWLNLGDSYVRDGGGRGRGQSSAVTHTALSAGSVPRRYLPPAAIGLRRKNLLGMPWRVAFALQADGWILRTEIVWHKPNAMPESIPDRPTRVHEYVFLFSKRERYYYDAESVKERTTGTARPRGNGVNPKAKAATAGAGKKARTWHGVKQNESFSAAVSGVVDMRNKRSVWRVLTQPYKGTHFACFPPKLIEPCIMAGAPLGGMVLDPFLGSGTTGMVAEALGRKWFGIELNPDYEKLILERTAQVGLFGR